MISKTKMSSQAPVQAQDNLFQLLFEKHPMPMWIYDLETLAFLDVNDAAIQTYGYTRDEFLKLTLKDIRPAEDVPLLLDDMKKRRPAWQFSMIWRHQLKDGQIIEVEITSHTLDFKGRKCALVTAQDVTDRKRAEHALQESEARYRDLVENSHDLICTHDLDGNILSVNDAASKLTGYPREVLLKMNLRDALTEASAAQFDAYLEHIRTSGHARGRMHVRTANGDIRIWEFNNTLNAGEGRQPVVRGMARDITEERGTRLALEQSEKRFRALIKNGLDNISLLAVDGTLLWESPSTTSTLGYAHDQYVGRNIFELMHPDDMEWTQELFEQVVREPEPGAMQSGTFRLLGAKGEWHWVEAIATNMLEKPHVEAIVINYRDITDRKRMEDTLHKSEQRYRMLFEDSPLALMEQDFSELKEYLASLKQRGVQDFRAYFDSNPDAILKCAEMIRVWDANRSAVKMYQAENEEALIAGMDQALCENELNQMKSVFIAVADGKTSGGWEGQVETMTGRQIEIDLQWSVVPGFEHDYSKVIVTTMDVTERKQAEQALQKSEALFKNAFENSAIGMALVGLDGTWLRVNPMLCSTLGYTEAEFLKKTFQEITHPDDLETDLGYIHQLLTGEIETYTMEKRYFHKNGDIVWVLLAVALVKDNDGNPLHFISQVNNITDRKQAENELRETKNFVTTLLELLPASIYVQSPDHIFRLVNRQWEQDTRLDRSDAIDHSLREVFPPDMAAQFMAENRQILKTGSTLTAEEWFRTPNGLRCYYTIKFPLRNANEIVDSIGGISLDITERKQAEKELQNSEQRYRDIAEDMPAMVCRFQPDGTLTFINSFYCEYFGKSYDELIGSNLFSLVPESEQEIVREKYRSLTHEKPYIAYEYRTTNGKGEECWQRWTDRALFNEQGKIVEYQSIGEDVTERKRKDEALRLSEERFSKAFHANPTAQALSSLEDGEFVDVNDNFLHMFQYERKELIGHKSPALKFYVNPSQRAEIIRDLRSKKTVRNREVNLFTKSGEIRHTLFSSELVLIEGREHILTTIIDVTDRKRAEEALRRVERRSQALIEKAPDGIALLGMDGMMIFASPSAKKIFGYEEAQILGINPAEYTHPDDLNMILTSLSDLSQDPSLTPTLQYRFRHSSGDWLWVESTFTNLLEDDSVNAIVINFREITKQKLANDAREESEQRYRSLFEDSPVALWEEDFSAVKLKLDELKQEGITDFATYFSNHPEVVMECASLVKILNVNKASIKLFKAKNKADLVTSLAKLLRVEEFTHQFQQELINIANGITYFEREEIDRTLDGDPIDTALTWSVMPGHEDDLSRVIISIVDVTSRKRAEEQRIQLLNVLESSINEIYIFDAESLQFQYVNQVAFDNLGYSRESMQMMTPLDLKPEFDPESFRSLVTPLLDREKEKLVFYTIHRRADGSLYPVEIHLQLSLFGGRRVFFAMVLDVTERKQAEEERKRLVRDLTERVKELTYLHAMSGIFMDYSRPEDVVLQEVVDMMPSAWQYPEITVARIGYNGTQFTSPNYKRTNWMQSQFFDLPNGDLGFIEVAYLEERPAMDEGPFLKEERQLIRLAAEKLQTYLRGILADRAINRQLAELETLYKSGLAINRLLTPREIAQQIIETLENTMNWHHIAIREYDAQTDRVNLIGFHRPGIGAEEADETIARLNKTMVSPAQGLSGWVTLNGKPARVPDLAKDERYIQMFPEIRSGVYVPLKIGKQVIGSISVESEMENAFSEHDERLLETLAGQAAIAIQNANLFSELQTELIERRLIEEEMRQLNVELEQRVEERTAQTEATKRRLELATHAGQIGVWEYIPRENRVIWDERMHMIHHASQGDFAGTAESWATFIHPDDIEKSNLNSQLAFTENLLFNNEHRIRWQDGTIRHISTRAVTAYAEDGTPDRVIGICMDITERKQIEQSLRESEAYARLLFDAAPDPVSVAEVDGTMVDVNSFFELQHQIKREDMRGRNLSELDIFPPEELAQVREYTSRVAVGENIPPVELRYNFPGNGLHTLEMRSYAIEVGGRQLILSTSRDITEHKRMEQALKLANQEMEHVLKVKDEFLASMSHELRTPLNAILGISESLEEQVIGELNDKQLKYVYIIKESGRHLLDLINDILDISKIEAGRMELDFHPISVEKLCQSSLRMVKELAQKKSLGVSFKVMDNVKVVMGDERRLKQAIVNLLGNAIKFTEEGKRIGLEVKGDILRRQIHITVWDTGIGIEKKNLKYLFKPFVQLDSGLAREYQGTGLGLALVAQMIRLHGGNVSVESEPGLGSRFTITLPWHEQEQHISESVTGELTPPSREVKGMRKGKILLVEDTDIVVAFLDEYLQHKGYQVVIARNGNEGIIMAKNERPDLILMDVMMPIMDGMEATREIRKDPSLREVPIVALTALAMPGDRDRCFEAGMTDYLSKPVRMDELSHLIEKYIS